MALDLRLMQVADLDAVAAIQRACYANQFIEPISVIRSRLAQCPDTCWVTANTDGVSAYLFGYHSRLGRVTPLGGQFCAELAADCLYLHDLAVLPRCAGLGIGHALIRRAWQRACDAGLRHSALVAVQHSLPFWQRVGYRPTAPLDHVQAAHLASYGTSAYYLSCQLNKPE